MTQVVPTCAKWGWLGLLAGIALACTSGPGFDPPASAGDVASESGGQALSGGTTSSGGAVADGGTQGSGGFGASGGVPLTGGSISTGGADATGGNQTPEAPGGCRVNMDCEGMEPRCLRPGETWTATPSCGAVDWCGKCSCPSMPQLPSGAGSACQNDWECQALSADLLCGPENVCARCGEDADCPSAAPRCSAPSELTWLGNPASYRGCVQCATHDDCGDPTPACDTSLSDDGQSWGRCVECAAGVPCAKGTCMRGMCVPQCTEDLQCGDDGLRHCSALNRCEPTPCATDADCGALGVCGQVGCERQACANDSACGQGHACVQGECFADGGSCVDTYQLPVP